MKLEFLNFVFNQGDNVTVRLGLKWFRNVKPDDYIMAGPSDEDHDFEVRILAVMACPLELIPESWLALEHDPKCRNLDGLIECLKETYSDPSINRQTVITALMFR